MKKIHIFYLTTTIAAVFIAIFFIKSAAFKPNESRNGFTRLMKYDAVKKQGEIKFGEIAAEVVGITDSLIYVSTSDPAKLLTINRNILTKFDSLRLRIKDTPRLYTNFKTVVEYPNVYILGSNVPIVIKYNLKTKDTTLYKMNRTFSSKTFIPPTSIFIKSYENGMEDPLFKYMNLETGKVLVENGITDVQHDAGFATSGMPNYDKHTNTIVYVHFFSNKLFFIDTSVNLIATGRTVDTLASYQAKAEGKGPEGKQSFSYTSPPRIVNLYSTVSNGILYVLSKVRGDGESMNDYSLNSVIDLYDIKSRSYIKSIYVPHDAGEKLHSFVIDNNKLYGLFKDRMNIYTLNF